LAPKVQLQVRPESVRGTYAVSEWIVEIVDCSIKRETNVLEAAGLAHTSAAELFSDVVVRNGLADHEEFILQPDCLNTGALRRGAIVAHTVDNSQQG